MQFKNIKRVKFSKTKVKKYIYYLSTLIISILIGTLFIYSENVVNVENQESEKNLYKVIKVIDGDTIELEGGEKLRYIGIDTPETKHPTKGTECFGIEAFSKNKDLVLNKKVEIVKDVSDRDRFGRLLRYVYLEDGTFVNNLLLEEGFARVATFPPDVSQRDLFLESEQKAKVMQKGLWNKEICK